MLTSAVKRISRGKAQQPDVAERFIYSGMFGVGGNASGEQQNYPISRLDRSVTRVTDRGEYMHDVSGLREEVVIGTSCREKIDG